MGGGGCELCGNGGVAASEWMWIFFFPALLCESQGMVTINILYSLKPSKNTIFGEALAMAAAAAERCAHFLAALPPVYTSRPCYAGCRSYLHIYKYWAVQ